MRNDEDLSWKELELESPPAPGNKNVKAERPKRAPVTLSKRGLSIAVIAMVLCVVTILIFVKMSNLRADVASMEARLSDLVKSNEKLRAELSDVTARISQLKVQQRERQAVQPPAAAKPTPAQKPAAAADIKKQQPKRTAPKPKQAAPAEPRSR